MPGTITNPEQRMALPRLRSELEFMQGPCDRVGAPAYLIYDPIRDSFFQIGEREAALLSCWNVASGEPDDLVARVERETGLSTDREEIAAVSRFLVTNELAVIGDTPSAPPQSASRRFFRLTSQLLFHRRHLLNPAPIVALFSGVATPFLTAPFAVVSAVAGIAGLYLAWRDYSQFVSSLGAIGEFEFIAAAVLAFVISKAVHEFAHALVAAKYGVCAKGMGVAFFCGLPLFYVDVSGAWRLTSRKQRLLIGAAGVLAELYLAAWFLLAWAFLPDGPLRTAAFLMATVGWAKSVAINLNPLVRFDGYYLLCDYLRFPNIATRGSAALTWRLRELFLGLGTSPPEPFPAVQRRLLVFYAASALFYRLLIFFGIALFLYSFFFKAAAIIMVPVAILVMILWPACKELYVWWEMRAEVMRSGRIYWWGAVALCGLVLALIPFPEKIRFAAVLQAGTNGAIHAPRPARIASIERAEGDIVVAGDVVARLEAEDIDFELAQTQRKADLTRRRLARAVHGAEDLEHKQVLEQTLVSLSSRRERLFAERQELVLRSPINGRLVDVDETASPGSWVQDKWRFGSVAGQGEAVVIGYLPGDKVEGIVPGSAGVFVPDDPLSPTVAVRLEAISATIIQSLEELELAVQNGGTVQVMNGHSESAEPLQAYHRLRFLASTHVPQTVSRGAVHLSGKPRSLTDVALTSIWGILVRESGF